VTKVSFLKKVTNRLRLWWTESNQPMHKPARGKVDTDTIRTRIYSLGWQVKELPVKKKNRQTEQIYIERFKLIAIKNERSVEISGKTIDEAMKNLGETLGVIPRESLK